eukprot:8988825-Ditylum_brightwellii.AAC.1
MDKEGFNTSFSTLIEFTETCVCYKECKPKASEKICAACKSHSKKGGSCKAKHKASEKAYRYWGQDYVQCHSNGREHHYCKYHGYCNHSTDECKIKMSPHKGSTHHEMEDRSHKSKKVYFSSDKAKS